jgi:hypothetical protein
VNNPYWTLRQLSSLLASEVDAVLAFAQAFNSVIRGFEFFKKELEHLIRFPGDLREGTMGQYSDLKERYNAWINDYEKYLRRLEKVTGRSCALSFERFGDVSTLTATPAKADSPTSKFFPSQSQFDAHIEIGNILARAKQEILIVDGYVDESVLTMIAGKANSFRILTFPPTPKTQKSFNKFNVAAGKFRSQYASCELDVRTSTGFHDRFVVIDRKEIYHLGTSIKDAGKKGFRLSRIEEPNELASAMNEIENKWQTATTV